ncbi:carbohydrate-binding module family 18 protein [Piromyces sp. E2]|nr:carbohydrate-binding module family 18 protein [Piromyces sp. E2]|eukprot:OUM68624.1 carbohydrate-binding module family 18 protein [Piromyces sp. E2]
MKLFFLLLFCFTLINNVLSTSEYYNGSGGYYILVKGQGDYYCDERYIEKCNTITKVESIRQVDGRKFILDYMANCIRINGELRAGYYMGYGLFANPFEKCSNTSVFYRGGTMKIYDCRDIPKNNGVLVSNPNKKMTLNYMAFPNIKDRILTSYGWCKYDSDRCGKGTGLHCHTGYCCSQYGYCGKSKDHCGKKCQGQYGHCN